MSDSNEPLDERVKRLEAEAAELRKKLAEVTEQRDTYHERYQGMLHEVTVKAWEGVTQADLDAAIASPVTLQTFIDQLDKAAKNG